jgi:hypothetical protein
MNDDSNFMQLPNIRPIPYPDRPAYDPVNHQHDTVYSLNFGLRLLARTINEDQWRSAIDYSLPEGARISVRKDDRGSHIIRYILIRTEHSFRRVTYMYRPGEPEPEYDADTQFRLAEPIQAIPSDTRLVVPPVE